MKYGLFIGINQYTNGITPLKCARNDALALSKLFALNGYEVNVLLDHEANATNIRKILRSMGKQLKNDDVFFFYFSGHGCEVNKNHYLIGQAAYPDGIDEGEETVALNRVRELTDIPGVRRLFVLDCCRNDLHGGKGLEVCPESRDIALAKISNFQYDTAEIIHPLIVTSCSTGERSYEDVEKGRGYFTQILESTLNNNMVKTFESFRKKLAAGMEEIYKTLKQKQTLCWHGNVDSWDDFKLLESWSAPASQENFNHTPENKILSPKERLQFNDLILSLEEPSEKLMSQEAPAFMKDKWKTFRDELKSLADADQTQANFQKIRELQTQIENANTNLKHYQDMQQSVADIEKNLAFLKEYDVAPDAEFYNLEKRAIFAQKKDDFEVAGNLWKMAENLIEKQVANLNSLLKNIEKLNAEIKKTEDFLCCDSAFLICNFGYTEQRRQYEKSKNYEKLQKCLNGILKNNREQVRLQTEALNSISALKQKLQLKKDTLPAEPEHVKQLCEDAEKYYDQKKYIDSEKCWETALHILNQEIEKYESFQQAQKAVDKLEKKFNFKNIPLPVNIQSMKNEVLTFASQQNYSDAESCLKDVADSLKKNLDTVELTFSLREEIKQLRVDLEKNGYKIPPAYDSAFIKANQAHEELKYDEELKALDNAKNILKNLIEENKQARIEELKKTFEQKNKSWLGIIASDSLLERYGFGDSCKLEKEVLWNKRLRVLEFEKLTFKLFLCINVVSIVIDTFLVLFDVGMGYALLNHMFVLPVVISLFLPIRFRWILLSSSLGVIEGIILGLMTGLDMADCASRGVGFAWGTFLMQLMIPMIIQFTFNVNRAWVWKHFYGEIINMWDNEFSC